MAAEDSLALQTSTSAFEASESCTQELLLSVASAVSSLVDLSDLAKCLGISLNDTDEGDTVRDKALKLFLLWQSTNCGTNSKAKFFTCLQQLNNASINEILIKKYHAGMESQVQEQNEVIALHCSFVPMANDHLTDLVATDSEDSERVDPFLSGRCASVEEATGLSSGVSQQLIYGQCTNRLDLRSKPELFTKVEVTKKIAEKEKHFSKLLCEVQRCLQKKCSEDDIQDMKVYLTSLSVSIKEDTSPCVFTSHQAEIIAHSKIPQIFQWLTLNGFWSFLNFFLLESLVDEYGDDSLKTRIAEFREGMEKFKEETKLADFLPAWSGRCPHVPASGFEPIILRVNKDWPNWTLADVAKMEGYLESRFLINRFILKFANSHPGSVVIMWLIPSHAIPYLKKIIASVGTKSFSEVGIVEVMFGDKFIVKASTVITRIQPLECTSTSPIKAKALENGTRDSKTLLECGDFEELYATSIQDREFFWGTLAKQFLQWDELFEKVLDCNKEKGDIKWFTGGKLNVSVNCVDRHAVKHPDRVALIWEKDEPEESENITYKQLLQNVCQIANVLKSMGVKKGDTVAIYMPACPMTVASMLACTRIGAVHSVLFSKFAWMKEDQRMKLLKERIAGAKVIVTANTSPLSGKDLPLKESLEVILESSESKIQHVLVYKRTDKDVPMKPGRDEWLEEAMEKQSMECEPESMDSEDDLFVMFTSGVTGTPKGIVHSQAGYLLHTAVTHKYYFDYQPGEIFACTADIGWITGHSYVVYGPLCNGATTVLYDSTALYPSPARFWEIVEKLKINHFYTTPSVIQKLMSLDKDIPSSFDLSSLRIIASVGECLNKEAWKWFNRRFGNCRCHFIDTWWQTELGGIAIAPHPYQDKEDLKPGFIMKPSFGVVPCLIDKDIKQTGAEATGELYLEAPLPGMGRWLIGDQGQDRFKKEYFKKKHGKTVYYTSDVAHRDKHGDYQIYSRAHDAIRYRGELLNLPIIEGAANASHESIEETVLVLKLDNKDNEPTVDEPNLVAHVQLKDVLTPKTEEDVIFNVQESIKQTAQIERKKVQVKLYPAEQDDGISRIKTFSGKTIRQELRFNYDECDPHESRFKEYHHPLIGPSLVSVN